MGGCDLPSQLPAVARDACLALVRRGLYAYVSCCALGSKSRNVSYKLSPMTTQAKGPQVMAKDAMNMQAATIMTMPELSYSAGGRAIATAAKIRSHIDCHRPPAIKGIRRPSLSMRYKPGKVVTTLTAPRISWTNRGSSIPADVKMVAPYCVTSQRAVWA
jgi:hypothetical protein